MKYRNKPVVREAVKFNGENFDEIREFMGSLFFHPIHNRPLINTLEGDHLVSVGDYIIKVVKGEFYPCKPDIFEMAYEPADNPDPRDELIRVYERVLGFYAGGRGAWGEDENGGLTLISSDDTDTWPLGYSKIIKGGKRAREALAQGAEIKKRMEEG